MKFVLSASGHIAGVISPPGGKYGYWQNDELPRTPDEWFEKAAPISGSWWPAWDQWVSEYAGKTVAARNGFRETSGHRGCAGLSHAGSGYGLSRGFSGTRESQIIAALPRTPSCTLAGWMRSARAIPPCSLTFFGWLVASQLFAIAVVTVGRRGWPITPGWSGLDPGRMRAIRRFGLVQLA